MAPTNAKVVAAQLKQVAKHIPKLFELSDRLWTFMADPGVYVIRSPRKTLYWNGMIGHTKRKRLAKLFGSRAQADDEIARARAQKGRNFLKGWVIESVATWDDARKVEAVSARAARIPLVIKPAKARKRR